MFYIYHKIHSLQVYESVISVTFSSGAATALSVRPFVLSYSSSLFPPPDPGFHEAAFCPLYVCLFQTFHPVCDLLTWLGISVVHP